MSIGGAITGVRSITLVQLDPLPDMPPAASAGARLAARLKAIALVVSDIDLPGKWKADATPTQTHTKERTLTSHPVENGFRITDHSRKMPKILSFQGIISDTPIGLFSSLQTSTTFQSRSLKAKAKLDDWFDDGEPLYAATSIGAYDNMILKRLSITRDVNSGDAIFFDLLLQEIRIGSSTIAEALADDAALLAGAGAVGNGGTLPMVPAAF